MLDRKTLTNLSIDQPIQQSVTLYDGGSIRHKRGKTLQPFSEKAAVSRFPNFLDERGQKIEPHVFTDQEVIEDEQNNDDRF